MPITEFLNGVKDRVHVAEDPPPAPAVPEPDDLDALEGLFDLGPDPVAEDPKPARRASKGRGGAQAAARVTAAQKRAVADALEMMITLPAGIVAMKDPVCGGAVLEHCDNVVKKLTPIVCRNPGLVEWFTTGAGYMDWFGLLMALYPIGATVLAHHVVRPQGQEESDAHAGAPDFSQYRAPSLG
jgi:hypothetical protein